MPVTREGGIVLFSSYSDRFWSHRVAWFDAQAAEGLVGLIDRAASTHGVIVCKDGFRAGRLTADQFRALCSEIGTDARVCEVNGSSVFCKLVKAHAAQHADAAAAAAPRR